MKHTISDLYQIQSMPLSIKVRMTENGLMNTEQTVCTSVVRGGWRTNRNALSQ